MEGLLTNSAATMSCTMDAYAAALAKNGTAVLHGTHGTVWAEYESYAMMRIPTFSLHLPSKKEVDRIFRRNRVAVFTYLVEAGKQHAANAWWYVCTDPTYSIEKLPPAMRRNVRRGLKEFTIRPLTHDQVLAYGVQAFCDTRGRVGLSDGREEFQRRFTARGNCLGHVFLGAWKGDVLAAFLSITEIDDWAEIEGSFSRNDLLNDRPNDALMYAVLSRYLVHESKRVVSYGLSSIQQAGDAEGLHAFKTKVGFRAQAVHRVFVLHPFLRPFATRLAVKGVNVLRGLFPRNRMLNKASGVLNLLIGNTRLA